MSLIISSVIAGSLAVIAWQVSLSSVPVGPSGSLQAVTLTNGQIYYGTLIRSDKTSIALSNVFYVQSTVDPHANKQVSKLINRSVEDWHAPKLMLISTDKIMFAEMVGPQSTVAKLIEEAKEKR